MACEKGFLDGVMTVESDLSTSDRLTKLEAQMGGLVVSQGRLESDVRQILDKIGATGRTNWALILSAIGVVMAIFLPSIGALAMFVSFSIANATSPLESKADVSERDRGELHSGVAHLGDRLDRIEVELKASEAKWTEKQTEQESQFRSADQVRNLQHITSMRYVALLWEKIYGARFPEFMFNPSIAQPTP